MGTSFPMGVLCPLEKVFRVPCVQSPMVESSLSRRDGVGVLAEVACGNTSMGFTVMRCVSFCEPGCVLV